MCNLHVRISVRLFEIGLGGKRALLNLITENGSLKPSHDMNEMTRINSYQTKGISAIYLGLVLVSIAPTSICFNISNVQRSRKPKAMQKYQ